MGISYGDRFGRSDDEGMKDCYGRSAYFDPRDSECQRCHLFNGCRRKIESRGTSVSARRPRNNSRDDEKDNGVEVLPKGETGIVKGEETMGERFMFDLMTGAARGAFWEGYQFFCNFRFGKRNKHSDE